MIRVTWYEAAAFCAWLTEQLTAALPSGYVLRLPTEAEWEVAAAYDAGGQRRTYPWGEATPTPELANYRGSKLNATAPVGCYPAGTSAGGALDLAGNVWEWTCSAHAGYPARSGTVEEGFTVGSGTIEKGFTVDEWDVPVRGGAWDMNSTFVRCGARFNDYANLDDDVGFRIVVAARSH